MPTDIGLWRVDGHSPKRLSSTGVPMESQLESFIEADPSLLGEALLLVGRQVPTGFGGGTFALSDPATVAPQILRPGGTQPRGRSLCADFGNLMAPLPTRRWVANKKICCADATRRLNATVPSRLRLRSLEQRMIRGNSYAACYCPWRHDDP